MCKDTMNLDRHGVNAVMGNNHRTLNAAARPAEFLAQIIFVVYFIYVIFFRLFSWIMYAFSWFWQSISSSRKTSASWRVPGRARFTGQTHTHTHTSLWCLYMNKLVRSSCWQDPCTFMSNLSPAYDPTTGASREITATLHQTHWTDIVIKGDWISQAQQSDVIVSIIS